MLLKSEPQWGEVGIEVEAHQFFTARWHELFHEHTFDSWQVRVCNTKVILAEMLDVLEVSQKHSSHFGNMESLIAELNDGIRYDPVIAKHFRHIPTYLSELELRYKSGTNNPRNLEDLRSTVLAIVGTLDKYKDRLLEDLQNVLM